jgi:ribosomal protein S18 acetylase RimI-like enzyme
MITIDHEPTVLATSRNHEESAIAPLVLAFASDPAVRWMYPDAHQYRTFFPRFARAFGGKAFALGTAHHLEEFRGTALWLPPGVAPDDDVLLPLLEETVAPERLSHLFAVFEQMGAFHPAAPHWHLPLLGVDPLHQSQGLGSVLIEQMLAAFDRDGAIAYLEASNPRNVPFYERHGFEIRGEIQAGDSPTIIPMVREPR